MLHEKLYEGMELEMKRFWVNLLVAVLLASLAMTCAMAETDEGIDLAVNSEAPESDSGDLEIDIPEADASDYATDIILDDGILLDDFLLEDGTEPADALELNATLPLDELDTAESAAKPTFDEGDIPIDEDHFPDANFRKYISNNCDSNEDGVLSAEERTNTTHMELEANDIADLRGIEYFTALTYLGCTGNPLTSLDVSGCPGLERLICGDTPLTSLDVSGCTALKYLTCCDSQLTSLDVSKNTALTVLYCENNQLTSLDVSGCTRLGQLKCYSNQLTSLNASGCTRLNSLHCYDNQLTSLNTSGCTQLTYMNCKNNPLTSLDVSGCTKLYELICYDNQLTSLDVSGCTGLKKLLCENNQFTSLDISKCESLIDAIKEGTCTKDKNVIRFEKKDEGPSTIIRFDAATTLTANGEVLYQPAVKKPVSIKKCTITGIKDAVYTGSVIKPAPVVKYNGTTLVKDTDYTVSYANNEAVGTATVTITGKGKYGESVSKTFKINPKPVALSSLTPGVEKLTAEWAKGANITGYQLQYSLKSDFSSPGKITVAKADTVQMDIKNLTAGKTYYVRMRTYKTVNDEYYYSVWSKEKSATTKISINKCKITGIEDAVYTGSAIKPAPVVKYNGTTLVSGTDYTVSYSNNKAVGTATVTITGIGKYGEAVKKSFKINPKPVALVLLTPGSKQLTVKWKKGANISGYEVQYSLKKSFASARKVSINKAGTVQTVLKKLTANKTYYVRVRTYKTVKGKKYYSTWSKAKSAKVGA